MMRRSDVEEELIVEVKEERETSQKVPVDGERMCVAISISRLALHVKDGLTLPANVCSCCLIFASSSPTRCHHYTYSP